MTDDQWNARIGTLWSALLSGHRLDAHGVVIEIGPGFQDKIGRGLAECQFRGTLYVVEPCLDASDWIASRYRSLLPDATVIVIVEPIPAAIKRLPPAVDAVLLNHVLDDMLLFDWLPVAERDAVFSRMRADTTGALDAVRAWRGLLDEHASLPSLSAQVVANVEQLLRQTRPRLVVVSQYASWLQRDHGLDEADRLSVGMLDTLGGGWPTMACTDRATLETHAQDPARWIVMDSAPTYEDRVAMEWCTVSGGRSA